MPIPCVRPLLGDTRRSWAAMTLAACVIVVVVTGLLFKGETRPDRFDSAVDSPVISFFRGYHGLLPWFALPGDLMPAVVITAAIALGCLVTGRPNGAVLAVIAVPAATGLDDGLLKHLFHRTYLGVLSFPSGHTTAVMGSAATLAILLLVSPKRTRKRAVRVAVVAIACLVTVMVAVAVIGLRFHYFTDTMAGGAVGLGTVLGLAFLLDFATAAFGRVQCRPVQELAYLGKRRRVLVALRDDGDGKRPRNG